MPWIDCCIRSAKDQEGVDLEHIIQDGGSTDGTAKLCQQFPSVHYVQKKDQGMYDAINRGFKRAQGDIFLQLNCDEQLLPGLSPQLLAFLTLTLKWRSLLPTC